MKPKGFTPHLVSEQKRYTVSLPPEKGAGFTLIELLVVVAVVLILIAIAVPNFLTALSRSKVSKAYAEIRSIGIALESYQSDFRAYPLAVSLASQTILPHFFRLRPLTTPVAYLHELPTDVFRPAVTYSYLEKYGWEQTNRFAGEAPPLNGLAIKFFGHGKQWVVASVGPSISRPDMADGYGPEDAYSPTNGTRSLGSPLIEGP